MTLGVNADKNALPQNSIGAVGSYGSEFDWPETIERGDPDANTSKWHGSLGLCALGGWACYWPTWPPGE